MAEPSRQRGAGDKERTWPYAVVVDPERPEHHAVRKPDGQVCEVDWLGKTAATRLRDLLNEAFDWGAEG